MSHDEPQTDELAGREFTPLAQPVSGAQAEAQAAEAAQAAAAEQMLAAGVQRVVVGLLKLVRAAIAKRLPEIHEEWTDPVLEAPAEAAVPLLQKHMARLMELVGSQPELAAFAMACIPLGMGYLAAVDKHQRTIDMPAAGDAAPQPS